jgi:tetratricopeptide (TPR) repeat protein
MYNCLHALHARGQLDAAENHYRRILADAPKDCDALMGVSFCARLRDDQAAALAGFAAAAEAHPDRPNTVIELARTLRDIGQLAEAVETLGRLPDHYMARMMRGAVARRLGETEAALVSFGHAHVLARDRPEPLNELVVTLRDQGRYAEALEVAGRLRQRDLTLALAAERGIGAAQRRAGDHDGALATFAQALAAKPADLDLLVETATEHEALGQPEQAIALVDRALAVDGCHLPALIAAAAHHRGRGDGPAALACLQAALAAHPDHTEAILGLGRELRDAGRLDEAAAILARLPDHYGAVLMRGLVARRMAATETAVACLEQAHSLAPARPEPLAQLIVTLRNQGRFAEALKVAERLRALDADQATAAARIIGLNQRRAGDRAGALATFACLAGQLPDNADWPVEMATECQALGRLEEAKTLLERALAIDQRHAQAMLMTAEHHRALGDQTASLAAFEVALAAHPDHAELVLGYAKALRDAGRMQEARGILARLPDHYAALMLRGALARRDGDTEAALVSFGHAHVLARARAEPLHELVVTLRDQGRYAEALEVARRLRSQDPARVLSAENTIGIIHRRAGDRALALAAFGRAAALRPDDADLIVEMATEYQALGQPKHASALLDRALGLDPRHLRALMMSFDRLRLLGDRDGALVVAQRIAAHYPKLSQARLHLSRALHELDHLNQAEAVLAEAEAEFGALPEFTAERITLLRHCGRWQEALAKSRAARLTHPRDFKLWFQGLHLELLVGTPAEIRLCLDRAPAATAADRGRALQGEALLAEREHRLDDAITHAEAAMATDPVGMPGLADALRFRLLTLDLPKAQQHLQSHAAGLLAAKRLHGKSPNASQNFLGKLCNELALDPAALFNLQTLRSLPPLQRIDALAELARHRPDHIPTATMVVIALRQAGLLDQRSAEDDTPPGNAPLIPRTIGQYWDAAEPPPDLWALHQSWALLNPEHEVRLFSDETAIRFLEANFPPSVRLAYARSAEPAKRADIFRLAYLWVEGGFWADMDDRATAPLASIVPPSTRALFGQEQWGTLGNNIMGVMPRMPLIGWALSTAVTATNRGDTDLLWFSTGPGLITRAFVQQLAEAGLDRAAWLRDVLVLERFDLYRIASLHCRTSHKKSQNHWSHTAYGGTRRNPPLRESEPAARRAG